ncbi:GNAT family N-acetyltransferase [Actinomadura barringtoniae]|uniref:GNAT family N-acetyltransferase n=1 Tax=Actinomadura barringtoniae TaxID=1427535 RepID=A0A939PFF9_9ACTN|nr:GNAT family N-acetyltransferase [Actinomadura barringtoniae]
MRFVALPERVMAALAEGDLTGANTVAGVVLSDYFVTEDARSLWRLRLHQIAGDPSASGWIARAAVAEPEGVVVGHAGFHGPPDGAGMVEVAYSVAPSYRRQGYARAMLLALLERAVREPEVRVVRASIRPDNVASLATLAGHGFVEIGQQWDAVDGLEVVFERPAD